MHRTFAAGFTLIVYPLNRVLRWAREQMAAVRAVWYRVFLDIPRDKNDPDDSGRTAVVIWRNHILKGRGRAGL